MWMLNISKYALVVFLTTLSLLAGDVPTVHQVYETAKAGDLTKAHSMIEEVIKVNPQSAKAHFVDAEILSRQGNIEEAKQELKKAQQLAPGLPFAKPQAVTKLEQRIFGEHSTAASNTMISQSAQNYEKPFPWMMLLLGLGAVVFIVLIIRAFSSRNASNANYSNAPTNSYPASSSGAGYGPNGTYAQQPSSGGLGSNLASGLAAGVGAGVGIVAGEALMHHFMDEPSNANNQKINQPSNENNTDSHDDMGGSDFGLNDNASWDESSSDSSGDDNW